VRRPRLYRPARDARRRRRFWSEKHDCLNLRFPGAKEFQWTLQTPEGPRRFEIAGPFESDDGDVLTGWALDGRGIVLKPLFEVADHLRSGALVPVATATPPLPIQLSTLSQHRRLKDPKVQLFTDYMAAQIRDDLRRAAARAALQRTHEKGRDRSPALLESNPQRLTSAAAGRSPGSACLPWLRSSRSARHRPGTMNMPIIIARPSRLPRR
jgi:hypothetical protein